MKIDMVSDKEKNELVISIYNKNNELLQSQRLKVESFDNLDINKILKFLKMLKEVINKLLEIYCKG